MVLPPAGANPAPTRVEGRRAGVDKSNAPNATIFGRSLYYNGQVSHRCHVRPKELSHFAVKAVRADQRNIISSEMGRERKTLSRGWFSLILILSTSTARYLNNTFVVRQCLRGDERSRIVRQSNSVERKSDKVYTRRKNFTFAIIRR